MVQLVWYDSENEFKMHRLVGDPEAIWDLLFKIRQGTWTYNSHQPQRVSACAMNGVELPTDKGFATFCSYIS